MRGAANLDFNSQTDTQTIPFVIKCYDLHYAYGKSKYYFFFQDKLINSRIICFCQLITQIGQRKEFLKLLYRKGALHKKRKEESRILFVFYTKKKKNYTPLYW